MSFLGRSFRRRVTYNFCNDVHQVWMRLNYAHLHRMVRFSPVATLSPDHSLNRLPSSEIMQMCKSSVHFFSKRSLKAIDPELLRPVRQLFDKPVHVRMAIRRMGQLPQVVEPIPMINDVQQQFLVRLRAKFKINPQKLLFLGHSASLFGVLALFMKDMLWLRTFMVCGSTLGVLFNLLQPYPLKIPAMWGCVFILLNLFQIGVLLHERRPITFKSEEAEVYSAVFQRHGVTPHQFEKLLHRADAVWEDLPAGHLILKEGDMVETVSVLVKGKAEVKKGTEVVGEVNPGCLIGETALLVEGHRAGHTVRAVEGCRVVQWPREKLSSMLACDQHLKLSAAQVINSDLAAKLENSANVSSRTKVLETYLEVMRAMVAENVIHPPQKRAMREYRTLHSISQEQHLEAVSLCGWTPEEFEDGIRASGARALREPIARGRVGVVEKVENQTVHM